jgi:hypothetical protein
MDQKGELMKNYMKLVSLESRIQLCIVDIPDKFFDPSPHLLQCLEDSEHMAYYRIMLYESLTLEKILRDKHRNLAVKFAGNRRAAIRERLENEWKIGMQQRQAFK